MLVITRGCSWENSRWKVDLSARPQGKSKLWWLILGINSISGSLGKPFLGAFCKITSFSRSILDQSSPSDFIQGTTGRSHMGEPDNFLINSPGFMNLGLTNCKSLRWRKSHSMSWCFLWIWRGLYRLLEGKLSKGLPIWKRIGFGQEAWIYRRLAAFGRAQRCD